MRKFWSVAICLVLSVAVLGGCATTGAKFEPDRRTELEKGMTPGEVEQVMGEEPYQTSTQAGQVNQYTYSYASSHVSPVSFIPVVGAFMGSPDTESKTLVIHFNDRERVESWNYSTSSSA